MKQVHDSLTTIAFYLYPKSDITRSVIPLNLANALALKKEEPIILAYKNKAAYGRVVVKPYKGTHLNLDKEPVEVVHLTLELRCRDNTTVLLNTNYKENGGAQLFYPEVNKAA